jgi:hypothetical protein
MKRNALASVIPAKSGKYASLDRKITRFACDPNRYYNAGSDEDFFYKTVGTIKAVRLG